MFVAGQLKPNWLVAAPVLEQRTTDDEVMKVKEPTNISLAATVTKTMPLHQMPE